VRLRFRYRSPLDQTAYSESEQHRGFTIKPAKNLYHNVVNTASSAAVRPKSTLAIAGTHWPRLRPGHSIMQSVEAKDMRTEHYVDIFGQRCKTCTEEAVETDAELKEADSSVVDSAFWSTIWDLKRAVKEENKLTGATGRRESYTSNMMHLKVKNIKLPAPF